MTGAHVRVVVADDHPVYLRGLTRAIAERPDLRLLSEAGTAAPRQRAEGLTALASGPFGWALRALGVDAETLAQARGATAEAQALLGRLDATAETLAPLGWLLFELAPMETYMAAAQLARDGNTEAAEELIVADWNGSDCLSLRFSVQRVLGLYRIADAEWWDRDAPDIGHQRAVLIAEAVDSHRDGRYASAINVTLAQLDGIVADFSAEGQPFVTLPERDGLASDQDDPLVVDCWLQYAKDAQHLLIGKVLRRGHQRLAERAGCGEIRTR